jgi:hypothetical protein
VYKIRIQALLITIMAGWVLATGSPAPPQAPGEEFIQGGWRVEGYLDEKNRRGRWFLEWAFEGGKFNQRGYPPLTRSGRYRVIGDDGDKLTLELFEQQGASRGAGRRLEIIVNRDGDQLKIGGKGPFLRVKREP